MLPIESAEVGTPCLVGPGCRLFDGSDAVRKMVVVEDPSDPVEIARKARWLSENAEEAVSLTRKNLVAERLRWQAVLERTIRSL